MPDIALGRIFSQWLRGMGRDPDSFPLYDHEFLDHRPNVKARLYPNELMTAFNQNLEAWIAEGKAHSYFMNRDTNAVPALDAVATAQQRLKAP